MLWRGEALLSIDVETRVCSATSSRLRERVKAPILHATLREISCISVLECHPGEPWTFQLKTFAGSEPDDLRLLDELLERAPDAALLTFNGLRHDLPTLEMRAIGHQIFDARGLASLRSRGHYDLMDLVGGHCSLGSLRACFHLQPDEVLIAPRLRSQTERKCEIDVVTTFLAFLHLAAHRAADPALLLFAWRDLAQHFEHRQKGHLHLTQLFRFVR